MKIGVARLGPKHADHHAAAVVFHPKRVADFSQELRQAVLDACSRFSRELAVADKSYTRALHLEARKHNRIVNPKSVLALFQKHRRHFRSGCEIDPSKIAPVLKLVGDDNLWAEMFMIARSCWSMPYSKGYGRRLRFVVYDEYHEGLMGVIGLQSPPADLACRDELFEYPQSRKLELVNSTMDAYTVGALPPYSYLIGGKLCAGLISTDGIRQAYWRTYAGKKTEMVRQGVQQPLAAVTTTSAFGRSSMYNRIKYNDRLLAEPIGFTMGYGTLHLEHLYDRMCELLRMHGRFTAGGYGAGPKVRWQNITKALQSLDLPTSLLQHGLRREVFLFRFVTDLESGMAGGSFGSPVALPESNFAEYWKNRWAIPRAERFPAWSTIDSQQVIEQKLAETIC